MQSDERETKRRFQVPALPGQPSGLPQPGRFPRVYACVALSRDQNAD